MLSRFSTIEATIRLVYLSRSDADSLESHDITVISIFSGFLSSFVSLSDDTDVGFVGSAALGDLPLQGALLGPETLGLALGKHIIKNHARPRITEAS